MSVLGEFIHWLPGYFFPKICYGCEKEGAYVCKECRKTVERVLDRPVCSECGREAAFGATHPGCRRRLGLDGLTSYYKYAGWAKEIVREAKFGKYHRYAAMRELAQELARHLASRNLSDWIIVPIPLHWWREFKRGFNQAELIADELAKVLEAPIEKLLIRRQYTEPQTLTEKEIKLTKEQEKELEKKYKSSLQLEAAKKRLLNKLKAKRRRENIEGAFEMRLPRGRTGRYIPRNDASTSVILVDDVWTTGATMKECCRVLKRAGVKRVWGMTLLRA